MTSEPLVNENDISGESESNISHKPGKRKISRLGLAGLVLASVLGIATAGMYFGNTIKNRLQNKYPSYNEIVTRGVAPESAEILAQKIPTSELTDNQKQAITIISDYSLALQKECVSSEVWDNRHISDAEVAAIRKAGLEGTVVNPSEVYAVLANVPGNISPEFYNQRSAEFALTGTLSFYKWLKTNGVDDEHIKLLVYNPGEIDFYDNEATRFVNQGGLWLPRNVTPDMIVPVEGDRIEVDSPSTLDNFYNEVMSMHPDKNDHLRIVISSPTPDFHSEWLQEEAGNWSFVGFEGGDVSSSNLRSLLNQSNNPYSTLPKYDQVIFFGQNFGAQRLISEFPTGVNLRNPEQGNPLGNSLSIAASNYDTDTMLMRLVATHYANPGRSVEGIISDLNSGTDRVMVSYHNQSGLGRNPGESPAYKQPFRF